MKRLLTAKQSRAVLVAEVLEGRINTWAEVKEAIEQCDLDETLTCEAISLARALMHIYEDTVQELPEQAHIAKGNWAVASLLENRLIQLIRRPAWGIERY